MSRAKDRLRSLFPSIHIIWFIVSLRRSLRGASTMLDVGCGAASPGRFVPGWSVGVDAHAPSLSLARASWTHDSLVLADASRLGSLFKTGSFDAVIALDLIEHLDRDEGSMLIDAMVRIARRRVVLFTPNGFLEQKGDEDDLQDHRSGWTTDDLTSQGFQVRGFGGPRSWRGGYHRLEKRPRALWGILALLHTIWIGRWSPQTSASLFAMKKVDSA